MEFGDILVAKGDLDEAVVYSWKAHAEIKTQLLSISCAVDRLVYKVCNHDLDRYHVFTFILEPSQCPMDSHSRRHSSSATTSKP